MDRNGLGLKVKRPIWTAIGLAGLLLLAPALWAQQAPGDSSWALPADQAIVDTLLKDFTVDELAKFREFYQNEIHLLQQEDRLLREKAIHDGEKIYAINPQSPYMDKVLFRLAEFYFKKEMDDYFRQMEEYEKKFSEYEQGKRSEPPEEPKPDFSRVIEKYKLILQHFPNSSLLDDVLYHLAYTYEQNSQPQKALPYYERVAREFPQSKYAPEALIRIAEYYFDPVRRNLDRAIEYYSKVLHYKDTPRYDEALYKLGWSYYLKENFDAAIQTFMLLVQDIEKFKNVDKENRYTNPMVEEEALEYIGICFHDAGGLPRALAFLDSLGRPDYGPVILRKLGDIYRVNEEKYLLAMNTYRALLERYPDYELAPEIQEKVVLCARKLEDPDEVYLAQKELFEKYGPQSEWYQHQQKAIQDPVKRRQVLKLAYQKSEFAERDNVNLLIEQAEQKKDTSYYKLAVKEAKHYLQSFPLDSSAYTIHWNMAVILDTKLHQRKEAFQAYLDLCNNYLQDKFRKFAAQNAIVVAREMLQLAQQADSSKAKGDSLSTFAKMQKIAAGGDSASLAQLQPEPLLPEEKQLIEAYRNFVIQFPKDPESAVVLANIGTIYYNKRHFNEALQYFNTLLAHFPNSPAASQAQLTALDSYFGKRDYASTEILAKRIQTQSQLPPELREKAKRRLAESIYLQAEALAGEKKYLQAAKEYRRVVEEVPDALFADKALFQAGVQFDLAKQYDQSIEVYNQLINRFPKSEHYLAAMNNLALDYGELKNYSEAAKIYEKLAAITPDSAKAQDALYNASYFYVQAKDWANAIRVNRQYVDRYPDAKDSEDMFYAIAEYYLKLDDLEHANQIYGEFASRYPNSPRTVETHYKRGDYFLTKGRIDEALQEFDAAIAKNRELKSKGLEANDFYAAEALFRKTEMQFEDYRRIRFTLQNKASAQKEKKRLLQQLVDQYTQVAGYGTIRIYEALFRIGQLYEEFASAWKQQEIPPMDQTKRIVFESKLNQTAAQLYEKAFETYKENLLRMRKLAANYKPPRPDTTQQKSIRVAPEDTTLQVANRWISRAGEKVSEMLFRMADLNAGAIERLLQAPIPSGLDEVAVLEYRNQVLAKAVFPIVKQVTAAHIRNLSEADSLHLNNSWVQRSRDELMKVMRVLPEHYKQLCLDAAATFNRMYQKYVQVMTQGTQEEQEGALDLAGNLSSVIELSRNYADRMVATYKFAINQVAKESFGKAIAQSLFDDLVATTVELAGQFKQYANSNRQMKDHFTVLNQIQPRMVYEDAIFTFSDNETQLHDDALALCETTYGLKKELNMNSLRFGKLAALLVELNPQTYASEFQLPTEEEKITPDATWLVATEVSDSLWMLTGADKGNWQPAVVFADTNSSGPPTLLAYQKVPAPPAAALPDSLAPADSSAADSLHVADTAVADSGHAVQLAVPEASVVPDSFYVLRKVVLKDIPLEATLKLNADDNVVVYVNGLKAFSEQSDSLGWGQVFETDITPFLHNGENWVAIKVEDTDRSGHGVQPMLDIRLVDRTALLKTEEKLVTKEFKGVRSLDDLVFNRFIVPEL